MGLSTYLANAWLNHLFGKATFTAPAHIYVFLSKADPTADGSGLLEPSSGSYARVETDASDWTEAADGGIENAAAIVFPTPTADWGDLTHAGLADASSGGNVLVSAALPGSVEVINGSTAPTFEAGNLPFSVPWG
jgi:hypothetical protein